MSAYTSSLPPATFALASDLTEALQKPSIPQPQVHRLDELQKFLAGSDWSALSSLDLSSSYNKTVIEPIALPPSDMSDAPVFSTSSSTEAFKPSSQHHLSSAPASEPCLTPLHSPFEGGYSDSAGSPDSARDFLTSPSLFDDADFEFDADNMANFPLFPDQSFEVEISRPASEAREALSSSASPAEAQTHTLGLEDVKIEDSESQQAGSAWYASQSTVTDSQVTQTKAEDIDHLSSTATISSSLDAAFPRSQAQSEAQDVAAPSSKSEEPLPTDLKPYYCEEETKPSLDGTLSMAFQSNNSSIKSEPKEEEIFAVKMDSEKDDDSFSGPTRSSKSIRQQRVNRASPLKRQQSRKSETPEGEKRWQCEECGKWFNRAFNLKTHMFTHEDPATRAKPYPCPEPDCQKPFARKHDMQRHVETVHHGETRKPPGIKSRRSRGRADDLG